GIGYRSDMGWGRRSQNYSRGPLPAQVAPRRNSATMVRGEGRHGVCRAASRASGVRRYALESHSVLSGAQRGSSRHHRLGSGEIQVRQYRRRFEGKIAVRPLLHQEHVPWLGSDDYVSDHKDCASWPGCAMRLLFWFAAGLILYAYIGYPIWLWVRSRLRPKPVRRGSVSDSISVVMVVRDGAAVLARKLQNLLELRYPTDNWNIVVVSDGSTDATNEILASYERLPRVRSILNSVSGGKAAGLNEALRHCDSDLIFFTDVRQIIEPNAFALLAENFADPSVGCVSGELMLGDMNSGESGKGIGLYWRIEKRIRELESDSGSVAGATGAIYAVRRKCIPNLPIETLLDDVFIPMAVVEQGYR